MSYFPVDDDLSFHPKVLAAGNEAIGMWARAGALCKKHTTGGFISVETARVLGPKRLADRLVSAGLWTVADGGYQFHDWTEQAGNDSADVERARKDRSAQKNRERQARWRDRQRNGAGNDSRDDNAGGNAVSNGPVTKSPSPSPRPRPTDDKTSRRSVELGDRARALGLTEDSLRSVKNALELHADVEADEGEVLAFCDHVMSLSPQAVRNPGAYLRRSVEASPVEAGQWFSKHRRHLRAVEAVGL